MPSETFHSSHLARLPGETVTESGLIVPGSAGRPRNLRDQESGVGFNSHEKNPDVPETAYDKYVLGSAAVETQTEPLAIEVAEQNAEIADLLQVKAALEQELSALRQELAELKGGKPLAEDQPRRVRKQEGITEKLIKHADGSFGWETISVDPNYAKKEDSAPGEADKSKSIEVTLASGTDGEPVAEDKPVPELESGTQENPTVGKELELYKENPTVGKELELYRAPEEVKPKFEVIISEELQTALSSAQGKYAEATAKERNGFLGHLLHNSKYLAALPGLQRLAYRMNDSHDEKSLGPARQEYKTALLNIQKEIHAQYITELGAETEAFEKIRMETMDVAIQSETNLEIKIAASRMERSGKTNKFINWWVRQDGLGGKLKKAAIVAGAGLTAGVVAGLAAAPLIVGIAAGASSGAGIGTYVTKRRANGLTEENGTQTLAQKQQREDSESKRNYVNKQIESEDGYASINSVTSFTEDRTARETVGNRARVRGATLIGGAAGGFGAGAGLAVREGIEGLSSTNDAPPVDPSGDTGTEGDTTSPADTLAAQPLDAPQTPELQGETFNVEPGQGYTNELVEFAQANGHELTPDQSWQLHQDLVGQFGQDYIDIGTPGSDVYVQSGDIRLMEPGSAKWADGVGQYTQQWMASRGLW